MAAGGQRNLWIGDCVDGTVMIRPLRVPRQLLNVQTVYFSKMTHNVEIATPVSLCQLGSVKRLYTLSHHLSRFFVLGGFLGFCGSVFLGKMKIASGATIDIKKKKKTDNGFFFSVVLKSQGIPFFP